MCDASDELTGAQREAWRSGGSTAVLAMEGSAELPTWLLDALQQHEAEHGGENRVALDDVARVFDEIARLDRVLFRRRDSKKMRRLTQLLHRVNYGGAEMRQLVADARDLE